MSIPAPYESIRTPYFLQMANKTIVITGASAGIGAELARRLGAAGHTLVLAPRRKEPLDEVAAEAKERGAARVVTVAADVTRRADMQRIADTAIAELGGFDVWVNNAGRGITRQVMDLTDEDVDE